MKQEIPYKHFDNFILRAPLCSLNFYKNITSYNEIDNKDLLNILNNPTIIESIYLASPELYNELKKLTSNNLTDIKNQKIKLTLFKYLSRMSSRCTPFGLFAGCSIGTITDSETDIVLKHNIKNNRHTRLDMNFVVALSQKLANLEHIKTQLSFSPNNTLYYTGKKIRYVEYFYEKGERKHQISSIDNSPYLSKILDHSKDGSQIESMINEIVSEKIDIDSATNYINDLIENQVLISNLEPAITGIEFFDQIITIIKKLKDTENLTDKLCDIKRKLENLDKSLENKISDYEEIIDLISNLDTTFNAKYLFQTDMSLNPAKNNLSINVVNQVKNAILALNKLNTITINNNLVEFKRSFINRYGEEEISLATALDSEIGIGYGQNRNQGDINPLIDSIVFQENLDSDKELPSLTYNPFINEKIQDSYFNNDYVIKINNNELETMRPEWENLPDTMSTIIELVNIEGIDKIKFNSIGGSSAANLLARFCYADKEIHKYVEKITNLEKTANKNKILAEIVHLPESRIGNVIMRPNLRDYEIPYLGSSKSKNNSQIKISDLTISVKNNKIILKSRNLQKEVIPRLTNAHNYTHDSLPIYQFLCELQNNSSEKSNYLSLNLGSIVNEYKFIPRIEFENIILNEASWNIKKSELKEIFKWINDEDQLLKTLSEFQQKRKIPNLILLVDGDNQLLIDLKNLTSIKMFLETIKNRNKFKIIEFLFEENCKIKNIKEENYTNEIILSFYKNNN